MRTRRRGDWLRPFDCWHDPRLGNDQRRNNSNSWYITNNPPGLPQGPNLCKGTLGNRSFINQVKYSPKFQSVAIVGTNDGNVQIGFNLGTGVASQANWVDVTGSNLTLPNRQFSESPSILPYRPRMCRWVMQPSVVSTPTRLPRLDTFFRSLVPVTCGSFAWLDKTGNLPDIPADSVIVNPNDPRQVFAGTDWGVCFTNDITAVHPIWSRFENGLPHAMVWDMQIDRGATTLSVWTRSRGVYVWPLPSAIVLQARPKTQGNKHQVQLKWSPADGGSVNLLRNGDIRGTTPDDGQAKDNLGTPTGEFTYQVCETDSGDCSNEVTVNVP